MLPCKKKAEHQLQIVSTATHLASFPLTTSGAELMFSAPAHKATDVLPSWIASAPFGDNGGVKTIVRGAGEAEARKHRKYTAVQRTAREPTSSRLASTSRRQSQAKSRSNSTQHLMLKLLYLYFKRPTARARCPWAYLRVYVRQRCTSSA